jgi:3-deoxy-7-phosphoheptulonate synthase
MSTNTRASSHILSTPKVLKRQLSPPKESPVAMWRQTIINILDGRDPRLLLIVGPCSIHDPIAAVDYARRLAAVQAQCPHIFFVMRTYFEKPRTRKGWSGFMHDPNLDGSNDMATGVAAARKLLLSITGLGVPTATETLSLVAPQYIDDLISFACIGARTTESQPHRELASGLSVPVGFKNSTTGDISVAVNSIVSASEGKVFMGVNADGRVAAIQTAGNPHCYLVLRGSTQGPNYDEETSMKTKYALEHEKVNTGIIVDASHGNSGKQWTTQIDVLKYVVSHCLNNVRGIMMESFIFDGNQSLSERPLKYGLSVTDGCIGWEKSVDIFHFIENQLK